MDRWGSIEVKKVGCRVDYLHLISRRILILLYYLKRNGAQGRNRTTDTTIFSRMLYQLSYLGMPGEEIDVEFLNAVGGVGDPPEARGL